jgi:hypothetical protein
MWSTHVTAHTQTCHSLPPIRLNPGPRFIGSTRNPRVRSESPYPQISIVSSFHIYQSSHRKRNDKMGNPGMTMLTTTYPRIISLSTRTAARISPIGNIHRNAFSSTTTRSSSGTLKKTPIYPLHVHPSNGAKMVPFAGFDMPLSYSKSGGQSKIF